MDERRGWTALCVVGFVVSWYASGRRRYMESVGAQNKDVTGPEADPVYCCFILIAFLSSFVWFGEYFTDGIHFYCSQLGLKLCNYYTNPSYG